MILLIFVTFWGILSYFRNKKHFFLISLVVVISSGLGFVPGSVTIEDLTLVMGITILLGESLKGNKVLSTSNDPIGKIILLILAYYFLNVVWTFVQGRETLAFGLKVFRRDLFYIYYFVFKKISITDLKRAFKPILVLTVIGGICYYLQFVGIHLLAGSSEDLKAAKGGFVRYTNTPMLGLPFMIYYIVKKDNIKFVYLLFFIGFLIMPMSRGGIMAAAVSLAYFIWSNGRFDKYKKVVAKLLLLLLLFSPVLIWRFVKDNERGNAMQDITSASTIGNYSDFEYDDGGTFTFRVALAMERFDYMTHHPESLLFGVGTIHEKSPNNHFKFYIGTNSLRDDGYIEKLSIDTEDIAFISHIFRYGFVYFFLFVYFIILCFIRLKKDMHNNAVGAVGFIFFLMITLNSPSSDVYSFLRIMLIPLLTIALIQNYNKTILNKNFPIK